MKPRDLIVILAAAGLALVLLILSRSGLLAPTAPPKNQTAPDITVLKQKEGTAEAAKEVSLWTEESKRSPANAYLRVSVNNRMYEPLPLDEDFSVDIKREGGYHNLVIVESGAVSMMFSTCDNQLCMHQGQVSLDNRDLRALYNQIVCLPNEVLLEVLDEHEVMSFYGEQRFEDAARPYSEAGLWSLGCLAALFILRFALRLPLMKRRIH